jgi:hypothetical protein
MMSWLQPRADAQPTANMAAETSGAANGNGKKKPVASHS